MKKQSNQPQMENPFDFKEIDQQTQLDRKASMEQWLDATRPETLRNSTSFIGKTTHSILHFMNRAYRAVVGFPKSQNFDQMLKSLQAEDLKTQPQISEPRPSSTSLNPQTNSIPPKPDLELQINTKPISDLKPKKTNQADSNRDQRQTGYAVLAATAIAALATSNIISHKQQPSSASATESTNPTPSTQQSRPTPSASVAQLTQPVAVESLPLIPSTPTIAVENLPLVKITPKSTKTTPKISSTPQPQPQKAKSIPQPSEGNNVIIKDESKTPGTFKKSPEGKITILPPEQPKQSETPKPPEPKTQPSTPTADLNPDQVLNAIKQLIKPADSVKETVKSTAAQFKEKFLNTPHIAATINLNKSKAQLQELASFTIEKTEISITQSGSPEVKVSNTNPNEKQIHGIANQLQKLEKELQNAKTTQEVNTVINNLAIVNLSLNNLAKKQHEQQRNAIKPNYKHRY